MSVENQQTIQGERFNTYSHLIGTLLALGGMVFLIVHSSLYQDAWKIVSVSIYGAALVLLYAISTLYHGLKKERTKQIFQRLDHAVIYILIAASYTPYTLVTLRGPWGWSLFGVSWGLCLIGVIQEFWIGRRTQVFSMLLYVVMGWLIVIAAKPLMLTLSTAGLFWLVLGGIIYTVGILFFVFDEKVKHFHGIWHLFVIAGSACHYFSILFYVGNPL